MIVQTGIFMLTAAGISILLWVGICLLTILYKSHKAERHDQRYTPGGTIAAFVVTGILGQIIYWVIAWLILQGTASATVMMMQSNAQTVYNTAAEYTKMHDGEIQSVSGTNMQRFDYSGDSLEAAIVQAFQYEMKPFWFKVTVDSKGNVTAAYFARHEITSKDMRPVDSDVQKKMLLNPYMGEDSITGMWTVADQMRTEKMRGTQGDAEGNR